MLHFMISIIDLSHSKVKFAQEMYTLSKGPSSKIVAKTRRGFSQGNLESQRELINSKKSTPGNLKEQPNSTEMSSPKPIFQSANGKRSAASRVPPPEAMSPQHEEMVKFVSTAWNEVCREYEMSKPEPRAQEEHEGTVIRGVKYYEETEPNPALDNFEPFDLESWWGKRLFNNLTQST